MADMADIAGIADKKKLPVISDGENNGEDGREIEEDIGDRTTRRAEELASALRG